MAAFCRLAVRKIGSIMFCAGEAYNPQHGLLKSQQVLTAFLFCKQLLAFVLFFFALMQKRTKKNQGKSRSLRAFLPC